MQPKTRFYCAFSYPLVIGLSLLVSSCGSTDKPEAQQTNAGDFVLQGLREDSGVFKVTEGSNFGTGISRESLYRAPDVESNLSFQLTLSEVGEEKGVTLYLNTDDEMNAGYGVQLSLDNHEPGEINVVVGILVAGVEQGGHFHLFEDVEVPIQLSLSIDAHPAEPHIIIMDQSNGNPTQNIIFDTKKSIRVFKKASLGQKLAFRLGTGAELSTRRPGPALIEE